MREFSIYTVIVITVIIMVRYILLLIRKEIKPALAMWLFFSVAIIMSLVTYRSDGGYGLLDNIMNTVDLIYVVTVSVAIFLFGDKSSKFTRFDRGCLAAVMIILYILDLYPESPGDKYPDAGNTGNSILPCCQAIN